LWEGGQREQTCDVPVRTGVLSEGLENSRTAVLIGPAEPNDAIDIIKISTIAVGDHAQARLHTVFP